MVSFEINAVIIFVIFLLSYKVFSVSIQEEPIQNREKCVKEIKIYFEGEDIYQHGKIAIIDYTDSLSLDELNIAAKGYYNSFKEFLRPGNVQHPAQFCSIRSKYCFYWADKIFGSDVLQIVHIAFYKYRLADMENIQLEHPRIPIEALYDLKRYLIHIRKNYGLLTTGFKPPGLYCSFLYPLPEN